MPKGSKLKLTHLTVEETDSAWERYKLNGDTAAREALIIHYLPLVDAVARKVGGALPAHISQEDLSSYGLFGLLDAMEKYDLERGIKFQTYASTRIRGAIIDELRTIDWIPRSVRSQIRDINQAIQALETRLQRQPTDQEVADHLGVTLGDLHHARGQQNFVHMVALDAAPLDQEDAGTSIGSQLEDNRSQSPALAYETEEIKQSLASVVGTLDAREATVLALYYYEGLTLAEIGQAMNVTESRCCQIHTRALQAIRAGLAS